MTSFETIRATTNLRESDILFTAGATIRIEAPPKHVFDVITDLPEYRTWNRDTPKMDLQGSEQFQKGSKVQMKVIMVDQKKEYDVPIEILQYEDPNESGVYVLAWRGKMLPSWFATSERVQEIRPIEDNPNACEVHNFESMTGWGAYVFKYVMGIPEQMKKFNSKYLEDLKGRAEKTWSGN